MVLKTSVRFVLPLSSFRLSYCRGVSSPLIAPSSHATWLFESRVLVSMYSTFATSTQFYLYGRREYNKTGYDKHKSAWKDDTTMEKVSLAGKVYIVTGANSGVGKEVAKFIAQKGGTLFMFCRSLEKANKARDEIIVQASPAESSAAVAADTSEGKAETKQAAKVYVIPVDCGLESSVLQGWEAFVKHEAHGDKPRLDGLVCNAGALFNEKQLTKEGVEATAACHLLFGTYLLGSLALPLLKANPDKDGRLLIVSSGGMLNTKWSDWETALNLKGSYSGNITYAYAKRGQVLLAEEWDRLHPDVKVVSCHPGWALTEGVDAAYGENKKWLDPMRTPWEGAEGIAWLLAAERQKIKGGEFYLDRAPDIKHIAGPFMTEGSFTKNTPGEVAKMMELLAAWSSSSSRPSPQTLQAYEAARPEQKEKARVNSEPQDRPMEIQRYMGKWYVIAHIPTIVDKGTANNTEEYVWNEAKQHVEVTFTYCPLDLSKKNVATQTASMVTKNNTTWDCRIVLGFIPVHVALLVHYVAEDYSVCVVGHPTRKYLYIMARTPKISEDTLLQLYTKSLQQGYNLDQCYRVPQTWPEGPEEVKVAAAGGTTAAAAEGASSAPQAAAASSTDQAKADSTASAGSSDPAAKEATAAP